MTLVWLLFRLVVKFRVDYIYTGLDLPLQLHVRLEICKVFAQQSYYYQLVPINNWQVTFFRAYPFPWELWIEDQICTVQGLEGDLSNSHS